MSFFDSPDVGATIKQRKSYKDIFVQLEPGSPVTVRVIEPNATGNRVWKHYIPQAKRSSGGHGMEVPCPGIEVCPICARNKELGDKEHPDFIKAFPRYFTHVLDLTVSRTCPLCGTRTRALRCPYDDNDLSKVPQDEPALRILEGSRTFFEHINTIEETIQAPYDPNRPSMYHAHRNPDVLKKFRDGEEVLVPVGITSYPLQIVTVRGERGRVPTPVPVGAPDDFNWEDYKDQRYEKWDAWLLLSPEEISALVSGASLVELLKSRHSTTANLDFADETEETSAL